MTEGAASGAADVVAIAADVATVSVMSPMAPTAVEACHGLERDGQGRASALTPPVHAAVTVSVTVLATAVSVTVLACAVSTIVDAGTVPWTVVVMKDSRTLELCESYS